MAAVATGAMCTCIGGEEAIARVNNIRQKACEKSMSWWRALTIYRGFVAGAPWATLLRRYAIFIILPYINISRKSRANRSSASENTSSRGENGDAGVVHVSPLSSRRGTRDSRAGVADAASNALPCVWRQHQ